MEITSYRFKLGAFDCLAVADGTHDYPQKSFFANTPLAQAEAALRERRQPVDYIRTPYTNLYVDTGEHRAAARQPACGGCRAARDRRHIDHARTPRPRGRHLGRGGRPDLPERALLHLEG